MESMASHRKSLYFLLYTFYEMWHYDFVVYHSSALVPPTGQSWTYICNNNSTTQHHRNVSSFVLRFFGLYQVQAYPINLSSQYAKMIYSEVHKQEVKANLGNGVIYSE